MSNRFPLFAASLALTVAACAPGEKLPVPPEVQVSAPAVAPPAKAAPPVQVKISPPQSKRTSASVLAFDATPRNLPQSRPTKPLVSDRPLAPAEPIASAPAPALAEPEVTEAARSLPAPIVERSPSIEPFVPPVAATSATTQLRTHFGRPPPRTELERLNPGMPRLVGPAPRADSYAQSDGSSNEQPTRHGLFDSKHSKPSRIQRDTRNTGVD